MALSKSLQQGMPRRFLRERGQRWHWPKICMIMTCALSLRRTTLLGSAFVRAPANTHAPERSRVHLQAESKPAVKFALTGAEQEKLFELGYSAEEVQQMRIEIATVVLERSTRRPWGDSPMPDAWKDPSRVAAEKGVDNEVDDKPMSTDSAPIKILDGVIVLMLGGLALGAIVSAVIITFGVTQPDLDEQALDFTLAGK
eukprot:TRINITY_DN40396_c0_g1_i1.p1 TRINITY_DN40396_c0_g1~~TRINITY_DN40396_c0_g1_i1.p1  ORF type:complete len:199 (+),score=21.04 TRINITY_DN40396_c0_g1_i1:90-686(+)